MTNTLTIMGNFDEHYGLEEWVRDNLKVIKMKTGIDLINDTVEFVHNGLVVKNEILDQAFIIKCDKEKSDEYDLGCIVVECALQEAQGVIWLANNLEPDLKRAFEWLGESLGPDFEVYLIEIEIKNTSK